MRNSIFKSRGDYINGQFVKHSSASDPQTIISPADLADKVCEFYPESSHSEEACQSAYKAYPNWSTMKQEQRNTFLLQLAKVYEDNTEEIAVFISRETGKPLWESRLESQALSKKIQITIKESLALVKTQTVPSAKEGVKGEIRYKSRGVFVIIGPFNFPLHLPNGQLIAALACGNTVIFKPSEKTPASAEKLAECFHKARFPKGVFNLVQGGVDIAKALIENPLVHGVFFTGSYQTGLKIKRQLLNYPQKILALEMGGKNSTLIWDFKDLDTAALETVKGAFLTSGQRCSSTSRLILHPRIKESFLERLIDFTRRLTVGHWRDNPFMGPLINKTAVDRFFQTLKEAKEEQAQIHLEGKKQNHLNGYYVTPSIVEPVGFDIKSSHQNQELFLPFIDVYSTNQEEEAFQLINESGYGLCVSIFSQKEDFMNRSFQNIQAGVFHYNLSSNGASPYLPFGGLGKSGNDRPAGLFAVTSCVHPTAWQIQQNNKDNLKTFHKNFFKGNDSNEN